MSRGSQLKPHMDRQNDYREGYNVTGALTFISDAMRRARTTSVSLATTLADASASSKNHSSYLPNLLTTRV